MAAPMKKRVIEMIDDDNSSTPTFNSPVDDKDEIQPTNESNMVGQTIQVPMFESQETGGGGSSPFDLATQPVVDSTKKRKASGRVLSDLQNSSMNVPDSGEAKVKTKKKKRSFQDQLLELLFMSGKPYTVKMLAQQLQTTDSSIEFCLLSLVDKGWIFKKEFASKSRSKELYWANQDAKSKELMDTLSMVPPQEIKKAQEDLARLQQEHTLLVNEITGITKAPSNAELNNQVQTIEKQVQELEQRLQETHARIRGSESNRSKSAPLTSSRKQPNKPQSSKQMKKRINAMRLQWKTRKEKCMDFVEQLADGMEKKVKEVLNLLELETDEMLGVKIPPKHDDV